MAPFWVRLWVWSVVSSRGVTAAEAMASHGDSTPAPTPRLLRGTAQPTARRDGAANRAPSTRPSAAPTGPRRPTVLRVNGAASGEVKKTIVTRNEDQNGSVSGGVSEKTKTRLCRGGVFFSSVFKRRRSKYPPPFFSLPKAVVTSADELAETIAAARGVRRQYLVSSFRSGLGGHKECPGKATETVFSRVRALEIYRRLPQDAFSNHSVLPNSTLDSG